MKKLAFFVLLSCLVGSAQSQDFGAATREKFNQWQKAYPQVKVFATFNQTKYAPGDTAFFKIYFLTEKTGKVAGRQVLHMKLLDARGLEAGQMNFGVRDGVGYNQFVLPDSLSGGRYRFTIYSEWMKNFRSDFYFQEEVIIVKKERITKPSTVETSTSLAYFPEGGSLIEGISNRLIVTIGSSQVEKVDLLEDGVVLTSSQVFQGLSSLTLTPQPGKKYSLKLGDRSLDITGIKKDGLSLSVTPNFERGPVKIVITVPPNSNYRKQDLTLLLTIKGEVGYSAIARINEQNMAQIMMPQTELPEGTAQLTVFNDKGRLEATRLFYVPGAKKVKATITATNALVSTREKIPVTVSLSDEFGNPIAGEFSVSAVSKKFFDADGGQDFANYLNIASDFGNQSTMVRPTSVDRFDNMNQWLITKTWPRFNWETVLSEKLKPMEHRFEVMLNNKGIATYSDSKQPVSDSTLIMVFLQKHMMGYEAYTYDDGKFDLPFLFDFWGEDEIFYLAEQKKKDLKNIHVEFEKDAISALAASRSAMDVTEDPYAGFAFKKKLINKSYSFFTRKDTLTKAAEDPNAEFEDEVMGADVTVNVQDYIIFPSMIELIREVVPSLQHRRLGGKTTVRVLISEVSMPATGDPLYIIDGIMTKNTDFFLSLAPADILTIKIVKDVNKLRRFGAMGRNGMVLVQTKKLDLKKLRESSTTLPVYGLSKPVEFKAPDYSTNSRTRVPDFRSTLFWSPMVKVDASGSVSFSFFSSDDAGPVVISVCGMTADGRPFNTSTTVNVNFTP
ncbi:MAG: hypothetical protein K2U26_13770, partial [Cyclobacteriaceae bacterium]|nr:hypothetical protein [Cyclobacteriaceae bacterium]